MRVTIVGCGDVGTRLGVALIQSGHQVTGVRRTVAALPSEFTRIAADVTEPSSLHKVGNTPADIVVYALAANGFTESDYDNAYVRGVRNTLDALNGANQSIRRFIFVSSTSVYHQRNHEWVDEGSLTQPTRFSGQRILEGERTAHSSGCATCVRFSGIYGPNRLRLVNKVKGGTISPLTPLRFTNRIHITDCAGVLAWLCERAYAGENLQQTYLATDTLPATAHTVEAFLAEQLGVDVVEQPAERLRNPGSKRARSTRLVREGYPFAFPSYREGYGEIVATL